LAFSDFIGHDIDYQSFVFPDIRGTSIAVMVTTIDAVAIRSMINTQVDDSHNKHNIF